jgi:hypothetical protein
MENIGTEGCLTKFLMHMHNGNALAASKVSTNLLLAGYWRAVALIVGIRLDGPVFFSATTCRIMLVHHPVASKFTFASLSLSCAIDMPGDCTGTHTANR